MLRPTCRGDASPLRRPQALSHYHACLRPIEQQVKIIYVLRSRLHILPISGSASGMRRASLHNLSVRNVFSSR